MICILLQLRRNVFLYKKPVLNYLPLSFFPPSNLQVKRTIQEDGTSLSALSTREVRLRRYLSAGLLHLPHRRSRTQFGTHSFSLDNPEHPVRLLGSHELEPSLEAPTPTLHVGQTVLNPLSAPAPHPNRSGILPFNLPDPTGPRRPHPTSYFCATWTQGPDRPADKDQNVHSVRCACAFRE